MSILEQFIVAYETSAPQQEFCDSPVPPPEYLQDPRRTVTLCDPPEIERAEHISIDDARQEIDERIRAYLADPNPRRILLVPAPPGSGKTYAGVKAAHQYASENGKRVLYAGPRHAFFQDILQASAEQEFSLIHWLEWLPHQKDQEDPARDTCLYPDEFYEWVKRGYKGVDFCRKVCGFDYFNDKCAYQKQSKKPHPLIYGHHNHIIGGHPLMEKFGVIIGDEDPMDSFSLDWKIPTKHILMSMDRQEDLFHIIRNLQRLSELGYQGSGPELLRMLAAGEDHECFTYIYETCRDFDWSMLADDKQIEKPHLEKAKDVASAPYNYLHVFVPTMEREAKAALEGKPYVRRIYIDKDGLTLLAKKRIQPEAPQHIIWFDATGRPDIYEALFDRPVEVVNAKVEVKGRIVQVVNRLNSKTSLLRSKAQMEREELPEGEEIKRKAMSQLIAQIKAIKRKHEKVAIITFMGLIKELREEFGDEVMTGHFFANRGSNEYRDVDALIVAGSPMPRLDSIEQVAKTLWPDRMEPFDTAWVTELRKYRYVDANGNGWQYPVSQFADPDLNRILYQKREAEIVQAAHRSRILTRDATVYLLTNIPIDELQPDELIYIHDLLDAPEGVNAFKWQEIVEIVQEQAQRCGIVTANYLVEAADISKPTAYKYMDMLVETKGWQYVKAIAPAGRRGRPDKALAMKEDTGEEKDE